MAVKAICLGSATSVGLLGSLSGQGMVIAVGRKPVAIAYQFWTGAGSGSIATIASSQVKRDALREMWLEPIVILRLEDGRHVDIAITQCEAGKATFEIVDDV